MSEVKEPEKEEVKRPIIIETVLNTNIDTESMEDFLTLVRNSLNKFDVLVIYLNSMGGQLSVGQTAMEILHSYNKKVVWVSELFNASLAVGIPLLNDCLRLTYPSSRFMMHDISFTFTGSETEIQSIRNITNAAVEFWYKQYEEGIGLTHKECKKLFSYDRYILATDYINMGTRGGVDGLILKKLDSENYLCLCRGGVKKILNVIEHKSSDVPNLPEYKEPE